MYLEEVIDLLVVVKPNTTLLKMFNPVEAYVPNLQRKTLLYLVTLYVSEKCTRSSLSVDILLKRCGHKLYTIIGQCLICLPLVNPKV
jgi:hypothetical protein